MTVATATAVDAISAAVETAEDSGAVAAVDVAMSATSVASVVTSRGTVEGDETVAAVAIEIDVMVTEIGETETGHVTEGATRTRGPGRDRPTRGARTTARIAIDAIATDHVMITKLLLKP